MIFTLLVQIAALATSPDPGVFDPIRTVDQVDRIPKAREIYKANPRRVATLQTSISTLGSERKIN